VQNLSTAPHNFSSVTAIRDFINLMASCGIMLPSASAWNSKVLRFVNWMYLVKENYHNCLLCKSKHQFRYFKSLKRKKSGDLFSVGCFFESDSVVLFASCQASPAYPSDKSNVKRPIHSQLNWAILLCEIITDKKNWVLTGNSSGLRTVLSSRLSHRELRSSLR
jgi:hypothetical protein